LNAVITIALLSVSYFIQLYTITILTDIYAVTFIAVSVYAFKLAEKNPKYYLLSLLSLYISLNFQYAAYVLGISYVLYILLFKRDLLTNKYLYLGGILFSPL